MYIKSLELKNYRNYSHQKFLPSKDINIIYGKNAQGKTNIVEAIYFLSTGKSFRTNNDQNLIQFNEDFCYINLEFVTGMGTNTENAIIKNDGKKSFSINNMPIKKLGDLFGNFSCIAFTPEDIKAIKESPSLRRKLIDVEISKIRKTYFFELKKYYKILSEKNKLLKSNINDENRQLLSVYNEQIAASVKNIVDYRYAFIKQISDDFKEIYKSLSGKPKIAELIYKPCVTKNDVYSAFLEKLESNMQKEIDYRQSLFGPHKEDFSFILDGKDAKHFASQGQQRTLMLAYKLSVLNIIKAKTNETPVLVLDDIFSELDYKRQSSIFEFIKDTQVFITTAVPLNIKTKFHSFTIENGKLAKFV